MISLIFCGDLKYCPYIHRYIERLELYNIAYEVVFWDRSGTQEKFPSNYKVFYMLSSLGKDKVGKLKDFWRFREWLKRYIDSTQCEQFVLLSTLSGVLVGNVLINKKMKYIFDIRDYSYEWFLPYYLIEKNIIKNSYATVISSKGFKSFLPNIKEYVIAHNFNRKDIRKQQFSYKQCDKIRIVWNGVIRFFDYQSKIIKALGNDRRFELIYHGDGPDLERLKNYCEKKKINNVTFTGRYDNDNKAKLLLGATILNNCYGYLDGGGNKLKYAISNKFYDGIIYGIPQIVERDGYKAGLVKKHNLGIALNVESDIAGQILLFLNSLDYKSFKLKCDKILAKLIREDDRYITVIDDFIKMGNIKGDKSED